MSPFGQSTVPNGHRRNPTAHHLFPQRFFTLRVTFTSLPALSSSKFLPMSIRRGHAYLIQRTLSSSHCLLRTSATVHFRHSLPVLSPNSQPIDLISSHQPLISRISSPYRDLRPCYRCLEQSTVVTCVDPISSCRPKAPSCLTLLNSRSNISLIPIYRKSLPT